MLKGKARKRVSEIFIDANLSDTFLVMFCISCGSTNEIKKEGENLISTMSHLENLISPISHLENLIWKTLIWKTSHFGNVSFRQRLIWKTSHFYNVLFEKCILEKKYKIKYIIIKFKFL